MKRFDYQPGNATRYDLLYGETQRGHVLVWLRESGVAGPAFAFRNENLLQTEYMKDKMGLRLGGDVHALLAFLVLQGHNCARELEGTRFNSDGLCVTPDGQPQTPHLEVIS